MDNILFLRSDNDFDADALQTALAGEYQIVIKDTAKDCLKEISNRTDIPAIIIDTPSKQEDIEELIQFINQNNNDVFAIAIIILTSGQTEEADIAYLGCAVVDCVSKPVNHTILKNRLRIATEHVNSVSFSEFARMLTVLPANIYLKDSQGRYVFSSQTWHHLETGGDPNWTIRGKTDLDVRKDKENAKLAMETDKKIIQSGKGTSYIIEEHDGDVREYLQLIKEPLFNDNGKVRGIIALINNVTEHELLKLELEKRSKTDQLTGLLNKVATEELVRMMIANYHKPNEIDALMMIDVDKFKNVNDTFGHITGDRVLEEVGDIIRRSFKGMDVAGRVGGDEFMVFLRDIDKADNACKLAEHIEYEARHAFDGEELEKYVSLSIGIALLPEHGKTFEELYNAADKALYYIKNHGRASYRLYDTDSRQ